MDFSPSSASQDASANLSAQGRTESGQRAQGQQNAAQAHQPDASDGAGFAQRLAQQQTQQQAQPQTHGQPTDRLLSRLDAHAAQDGVAEGMDAAQHEAADAQEDCDADAALACDTRQWLAALTPAAHFSLPSLPAAQAAGQGRHASGSMALSDAAADSALTGARQIRTGGLGVDTDAPAFAAFANRMHDSSTNHHAPESRAHGRSRLHAAAMRLPPSPAAVQAGGKKVGQQAGQPLGLHSGQQAGQQALSSVLKNDAPPAGTTPDNISLSSPLVMSLPELSASLFPLALNVSGPASGLAATAPPAVLNLATPLTAAGGLAEWGQEWGQVMMQQAVQMLASGRQGRQVQHAELRLNPPDLGALQVTLRIEDSVAQAWFASPHAAVREAVQAALPELAQQLQQAGLSLGDTQVDSGQRQFTPGFAPDTALDMASDAGLSSAENGQRQGGQEADNGHPGGRSQALQRLPSQPAEAARTVFMPPPTGAAGFARIDTYA